MNVVAIIQARCGSTRCPNKVFADISGKPLIWHVVNRLRFSKLINKIVLATTVNPLDDALLKWAEGNGVVCTRGNENNVLNRYFEAANFSNADVIVRITADDPFKEPKVIDRAIETLIGEKVDFVCNNFPPSFPEGLDVEVFTRNALNISESQSTSDFEREHVTQYIYHNPGIFKIKNISNDKNLSYLRWTIDTDKDLEMVREIYSRLYISDKEIFHMEDILSLIERNPYIPKINSNVARSEMYK